MRVRFSSPAPVIAPSQLTFGCAQLFEHQNDKNDKAGHAVHDHRARLPKCLVRQYFRGEIGALLKLITPDPCPIGHSTSFGCGYRPLPGTAPARMDSCTVDPEFVPGQQGCNCGIRSKFGLRSAASTDLRRDDLIPPSCLVRAAETTTSGRHDYWLWNHTCSARFSAGVHVVASRASPRPMGSSDQRSARRQSCRSATPAPPTASIPASVRESKLTGRQHPDPAGD